MKRKSVRAVYRFRTALLSDFCIFRMFRKAINRKKENRTGEKPAGVPDLSASITSSSKMICTSLEQFNFLLIPRRGIITSAIYALRMLLPADKTVGAFFFAPACLSTISTTFPPQIGANSFQMASFGITDEY